MKTLTEEERRYPHDLLMALIAMLPVVLSCTRIRVGGIEIRIQLNNHMNRAVKQGQ
jgi:hypothetical protein